MSEFYSQEQEIRILYDYMNITLYKTTFAIDNDIML